MSLLQILYGKKTQKLYFADIVLTGWIFCIGLAEMVHLPAVLLGRPFSDTVKLFLPAFLLLVILFAFLLSEYFRKIKEKNAMPFTTAQVLLFLAFILIFVRQLMTILTADTVYRAGDMTAETVESFLVTDRLYQVNPMTGSAYGAGIPMRLKILCLPTFYGILCKITGAAPADVVWKAVPVLVLVLGYLAFYTLANCFFPRREERAKREIFMLAVAVLFCAGDYMYGMDGLGILYSGFRGVTIRNVILVPYTFSLALRCRWRPVILCILAEACIVWTLYGLGICLLAAAGMYCVMRFFEYREESSSKKKIAKKEAGTEWK